MINASLYISAFTCSCLISMSNVPKDKYMQHSVHIMLVILLQTLNWSIVGWYCSLMRLRYFLIFSVQVITTLFSWMLAKGNINKHTLLWTFHHNNTNITYLWSFLTHCFLRFGKQLSLLITTANAIITNNTSTLKLHWDRKLFETWSIRRNRKKYKHRISKHQYHATLR